MPYLWQSKQDDRMVKTAKHGTIVDLPLPREILNGREATGTRYDPHQR